VLCITVYLPVLILHEQVIRPLMGKHLPRWLGMVLEPVKLQPPWATIAMRCVYIARQSKRVLIAAGVFIIIAAGAAIGVAASRQGSGLAEVFPPTHQRTAGRPLSEEFAKTRPSLAQVPLSATFCEPGLNASGLLDCGLHWCEAPLPSAGGASLGSAHSTCKCHRTPLSYHGNHNVTLTFAGKHAANLPISNLLEGAEAFLRLEFPGRTVAVNTSTASTRNLRSLVLEHWESGTTDVEPLTELSQALKVLNAHTTSDTTSTTGDVHVLCDCGPRKCQHAPHLEPSPHNMTLNSSSRNSSRMLQQTSISPSCPARSTHSSTYKGPLTEVIIVFGILSKGSDYLLPHGHTKWSFDPMFEPVSPWAQRAMLSMCENVPSDLRVLEKHCWIQEFRCWMLGRGEKFPVERFNNFDHHLKLFLHHHPELARSIWLDAEENMRATTLHMKIVPSINVRETLLSMRRWQDYVSSQNSGAASSASQAWATSSAWVRAEAYDEALSSSWRVCLLSAVLAVMAACVYTRDVLIVGCILVTSLGACVTIAFFMFCIFGWAFDPWELIILSVFLSHSVEPALHLGHDLVTHWNPGTDDPENTETPKQDQPNAKGEQGPEEVVFDDADRIELAQSPTSASHCQYRDEGEDEQCPSEGHALEKLQDPPGVIHVENSVASECSVADSLAASCALEGETELQARLRRSIQRVLRTFVASCFMLIVGGVLLLPCQMRFFSRLGAVALLLPFVVLPCTLVIFPALLLASGRDFKERDCQIMARFLAARVESLWS